MKMTTPTDITLYYGPDWAHAHAEDLACSRLALQSITAFGPRFALRANINDVLNVVAPHLVWTEAALQRLKNSW